MDQVGPSSLNPQDSGVTAMRRWIVMGLICGLILGLGVVAEVAKAQDEPKKTATKSQAKPKFKAKSKTKAADSATSKDDEDAEKVMRKQTAEAKTAGADNNAGPSFSKDVAPVLLANCMGCHNPRSNNYRRHQFDLTTFNGLLKGGVNGPPIEGGKPAESELLTRVKGGGEGAPKMPPGQVNLSPASIAKIEAWINAGARLEAGVSPTATLDKIAVTDAQRRREQLAKMTPAERDKILEDAAKDRFAKANVKTQPESVSGNSVLIFSKLSKERAQSLAKLIDQDQQMLRGLLSRPGQPPVLSEKLSVYVFSERNAYVEFVRAVESREVDGSQQAHSRLNVETPYLAAVDPSPGGQDSASAGSSKKASRTKKSNDILSPERSLGGLLCEELGVAAANQAGKPPRLLSMGLGTYLGAQVDRGSPYYQKLYRVANDQYRLGWETKATEALGGEADDEKTKALGLTLIEWMMASQRQRFPYFLKGLLDGQQNLDKVVKDFWNVDRKQFIATWGGFVMAKYGRVR